MKEENQFKAIIAEDIPEAAEEFADMCRSNGFSTSVTAWGKELLKKAEREFYDLMLLDLGLKDSDQSDLLHFFHEVRSLSPESLIIIVTANATIERAFHAARQGAYDFVEKAGGLQKLEISVRNAAEHIQLRRQFLNLQGQQGKSRPFITQSPETQLLLENAKKYAKRSDPVLITGESGVGKDIIAELIHLHSDRVAGPYEKINCGAIPASSIEGELFGWVKGAFTGAIRDHDGYFKQADGGTLFLDEIGDMPLDVQVKLLRVIEHGEIRRLGSEKPEKVAVRIVSATNQYLDALIAAREFRKDLFSRINTYPMHLPPLRERKGDIPLIAEFLLQQHIKQDDLPHYEFMASALILLAEYPWEGNVRELDRAVKNLTIGRSSPYITDADVGAFLNGAKRLSVDNGGDSLPNRLEHIEKSILESALRQYNGNVKQTAAALGIDRTTLYKKIEKYGIQL